MNFDPIGTFRAHAKYPYDVPRQAVLEESDAVGVIELLPNKSFDQALSDLDGFERIWIVYQFHHNPNWKPKTLPPRGPYIKRGVFATRSPYRPNPIGLSCVRLKKIERLTLFVQGFDLLDGTPVLDIKPYIPYADSFPKSKTGWLEEIEERKFTVEFSSKAEDAIRFLEAHGLTSLRGSLHSQLSVEPLDSKRKRLQQTGEDKFCLSYRTWRVDFSLELISDVVSVSEIRSGYGQAELNNDDDPQGDKSIHKLFNARYAGIT